MKTKLLCIFVFVYFLQIAHTQVGIGTTDPKASLDISSSSLTSPSNTDGILIPKIDNFPSTNPSADQDGMMVFATGNGTPIKGFYYWDNDTTSWISVRGSDSDFYEIGTTTPPDAIIDDIYTLGKLKIGQNSPANSSLSVHDWNPNNFSAVNISRSLNTASPSGQFNGFYTSLDAQTSDNYFGIQSMLSGNIQTESANYYALVSGSLDGFTNLFSGAFFSASGTGRLYGVNVDFMSTVTNTGDKYGFNVDIPSSLSGTHYGLYSNVQNSSGYAAYLIGRTSLGHTTANRYIMPSADGLAGQVMTSDGLGNISFETPVSGAERINDLLDAKSDNDGSDNGSSLFLGIDAGANDDSTHNYNVGIGFQALQSNISSWGNTAIGHQAMQANTSGMNNTATGSFSLTNNLSGTNNSAFGNSSLSANTSGSFNSAIGQGSLNSNTDGSYNTSLGYWSLLNNDSGARNVALGSSSGYTNSTGSNNVFIGYQSGYFETGSEKLYIENSNSDSNSALIYGEFDTNILRTNSEFQIGNPSTTGYAFPLTDGTNGQVMTTDGAGNISFQNSSQDADWYEAGTTDSPNDNSDNIFTEGNVGIGDPTPDARLDIEYSGTDSAGAILDYEFTATSGIGRGLYINADYTGVSELYGSQIDVGNSGASTKVAGILINNLGGTNNGEHIGIVSEVTGIGVNYGYQSIMSGFGTNFGFQTTIDNNANQNYGFDAYITANSNASSNYGVRSRLTGGRYNYAIYGAASGGILANYAGFFGDIGIPGSGNVYIQDNLDVDGSFTYNDGNEALGQILASDALGNASWINPSSVFTDTKNTLDEAYDEGGPGSGRIVIVNSGPIEFNGTSGTSYTQVLSNDDAGDILNIISTGVVPEYTSTIAIELENDITTNNNNGNNYGIFNKMSVNGTRSNASHIGFRNWFLPAGSTNSQMYGFYNNSQNGGTGDQYGFYNRFSTDAGSGTMYGFYNSINSAHNNTKYGLYSAVVGTLGTNYAVYAAASDNLNSWAGYFIGRMSLGNDTSTGRYVMPPSDGTAGQVMTTDGSGNISFQDIVGDGNTQNTLNLAYNEGGPGAGRGIIAVDGAVEINGEDGFQVVGTYGAGDVISLSGAGTRMFFNPRKAAFRAGSVSGNEWNNANIGNLSFAAGENNIASNISSTAFGRSNTVSGIASFSSGSSNTVSGSDNVTFGSSNTVSGNQSGAFGSQNSVNGLYAFALGLGNNSPSLGETTIGIYATVSSGSPSTINTSDRVFSVGIGTNSTNRANALTIYKNGTININDAYDLPVSDGTSGQVMTTDGSGNLTFQDPTTNTDNQQIDNFSFNSSTNVLTLEMENDGQAAQTVNLSSLNPTKSLAKITMSADQSFTTGTWQKLNFDTVDFDLNSEFNTTTDEFDITTTGYYRINASWRSTLTSTSTDAFGIAIVVNGVFEGAVNFNNPGSGYVFRSINRILDLNVGDTVEIQILNSGLVDVFSNDIVTSFEIEQIR